jgi:hypothetical protein
VAITGDCELSRRRRVASRWRCDPCFPTTLSTRLSLRKLPTPKPNPTHRGATVRRTWRVHRWFSPSRESEPCFTKSFRSAFLVPMAALAWPWRWTWSGSWRLRTLTDRSSRPLSPSYRGEDGSCGPHRRQAPAPCQRCRRRRRAQISGILFRGPLS